MKLKKKIEEKYINKASHNDYSDKNISISMMVKIVKKKKKNNDEKDNNNDDIGDNKVR